MSRMVVARNGFVKACLWLMVGISIILSTRNGNAKTTEVRPSFATNGNTFHRSTVGQNLRALPAGYLTWQQLTKPLCVSGHSRPDDAVRITSLPLVHEPVRQRSRLGKLRTVQPGIGLLANGICGARRRATEFLDFDLSNAVARHLRHRPFSKRYHTGSPADRVPRVPCNTKARRFQEVEVHPAGQ